MNPNYLLVTTLILLLALAPVAQPQTIGAPSVAIVSPLNGSMVMGPDVTLMVTVTNFTLAPDEIGMLPVPGHGHLHVLLDGLLTAITASGTHTLMGLTPGMHTVRVELHQNNHLPLSPPAEATVWFTVM